MKLLNKINLGSSAKHATGQVKNLGLLKDKRFWLISLVIMALFVLSRFLYLGARPIHHDEGMLSYFAYQLTSAKSYIYTPQIHGPVLFYLTALVFKFSVSNAAVRVSTALCGVILGLVALEGFKKESPKIAYSVAIMFLISPILIYYSRFLVHTAIVILFNLAFVLSLRAFFKKFKPLYLFLSAAFLSLAFGTSETSYIFVAILVAFIPVYYLLSKKSFLENFKRLKVYTKGNAFDVFSAVLIFAIVWLLLYSVGLTNLDSLKISLPAPWIVNTGLGFWLAQHKVHLGSQPWFYYLMLALVYEIVSLFAFLIYLPRVLKEKNPFELFLVWWTVGSFIGFSWAGEKFPWLFLPSLLPLVLSAGYFIGKYWQETKKYLQIIIIILGLWTIFVAVRLNFTGSYDTRELPVYVQTPKSFEQLADKVKQVCSGKSVECAVVDAKITWPLAWDFNGINRLEDFSDSTKIKTDETKYLFVEPGSVVPVYIDDNYTKTSIQLRDWWVPDKYKDLSSLVDYAKYFFTRRIWNDKGGYNIDFYEKK